MVKPELLAELVFFRFDKGKNEKKRDKIMTKGLNKAIKAKPKKQQLIVLPEEIRVKGDTNRLIRKNIVKVRKSKENNTVVVCTTAVKNTEHIFTYKFATPKDFEDSIAKFSKPSSEENEPAEQPVAPQKKEQRSESSNTSASSRSRTPERSRVPTRTKSLSPTSSSSSSSGLYNPPRQNANSALSKTPTLYRDQATPASAYTRDRTESQHTLPSARSTTPRQSRPLSSSSTQSARSPTVQTASLDADKFPAVTYVSTDGMKCRSCSKPRSNVCAKVTVSKAEQICCNRKEKKSPSKPKLIPGKGVYLYATMPRSRSSSTSSNTTTTTNDEVSLQWPKFNGARATRRLSRADSSSSSSSSSTSSSSSSEMVRATSATPKLQSIWILNNRRDSKDSISTTDTLDVSELPTPKHPQFARCPTCRRRSKCRARM